MPGRKPKPTSRQIASGDPSKIGKEKLKQRLLAEPNAASGLPECPRHLKGRARTAWEFWAHELAVMDLNRRPDGMMLEGACVAYQQAVQADLRIAKDGPVVKEPHFVKNVGLCERLKKHPAVAVSRSAWAQVKAFATEFGLSPVSRTRLAIEGSADKTASDLATLLSTPRPPRPSTEAVN